MRLASILSGVECVGPYDKELEISGITCDSRAVTSGCLFAAVRGEREDGHAYLRQAAERGAAAVLCETPPDLPGVWIRVKDSRAALAQAAANFSGRPAERLTVIGVTGTNGKTTSTYLLRSMLAEVLGTGVGLIGTNGARIGEEEIPTCNTTPGAPEVQRLLRRMADAGCTHTVMEVSSHALLQHRVDAVPFRVGLFTNLTPEHLDYHGTMEAYREAKALLFRQCETAVLNLDDEAGRYYAATLPGPKITYSERSDAADLTAHDLRLYSDRVEFLAVIRSDLARVTLPIPGGFSVYNALGALACGLALGLPLREMAAALGNARGVRGRIEVVPTPDEITVIIDYAHTGDALEKILTAARAFTEGRVICLFGCGGDRDREKRPVMGAVAAALADIVILTSDNPRWEDPMDILAEIRAGIPAGAPAETICDRREAIRRALCLARAGDTVLLCGKGHETYQECRGVRTHLDEREEVAAYYAGRAAFTEEPSGQEQI